MKYKLFLLSNSIQKYLLCISISMTAMEHHTSVTNTKSLEFFMFSSNKRKKFDCSFNCLPKIRKNFISSP